jgi:SAM-dependent methyltransferase
VAISQFTDVDAADDPARLLSLLDQYDEGLVGMKSYLAAAFGRAVPGGVVVDVGCGAGHDLARLDAAGTVAVGVDPSEVMVDASRRRGARRLVRADGAALALRSASVDGVRIERVLQHVTDPAAVVAEAARVVRPGGLFAAFEPDYTAVRVERPVVDDLLAVVVSRVRQPDIGGRLAELATAAGFAVLDELRERSRGWRLADVPWPLELATTRAVDEGRVTAPVAAAWLDTLREADAAGELEVVWDKIAVVATRRG